MESSAQVLQSIHAAADMKAVESFLDKFYKDTEGVEYSVPTIMMISATFVGWVRSTLSVRDQLIFDQVIEEMLHVSSLYRGEGGKEVASQPY